MAPFYDAFDFKENHENAKKWGEDYEKKQTLFLGNQDWKSVQDFNIYMHKINSYLSDHRGKLLDDAEVAKIKEYPPNINKIITNLDRTLNKLSIPHSIYCYMKFDELSIPGVGAVTGNFRNEQGKVNHEFVKNIIGNYAQKTFQIHDYLNLNITKNVLENRHLPFLMRVKLSPGLKALFLKDFSPEQKSLSFLVKRGYKLHFNNISLITDGSARKIKIEAVLSEY